MTKGLKLQTAENWRTFLPIAQSPVLSRLGMQRFTDASMHRIVAVRDTRIVSSLTVSILTIHVFLWWRKEKTTTYCTCSQTDVMTDYPRTLDWLIARITLILNTLDSRYTVQKCAYPQNTCCDICITVSQRDSQHKAHNLPVAASCGASVSSWVQQCQLPRVK